MVIDGMTLSKLLGSPDSEMLLASLIVRCRGVIVCRASPAQKAAILNLMKRYHAIKEVGITPFHSMKILARTVF